MWPARLPCSPTLRASLKEAPQRVPLTTPAAAAESEAYHRAPQVCMTQLILLAKTFKQACSMDVTANRSFARCIAFLASRGT